MALCNDLYILTYSLVGSPPGRLRPVGGFLIQPSGSFCLVGSQASKATTAASGVSYHQLSFTENPSPIMILARPNVRGIISTSRPSCRVFFIIRGDRFRILGLSAKELIVSPESRPAPGTTRWLLPCYLHSDLQLGAHDGIRTRTH